MEGMLGWPAAAGRDGCARGAGAAACQALTGGAGSAGGARDAARAGGVTGAGCEGCAGGVARAALGGSVGGAGIARSVGDGRSESGAGSAVRTGIVRSVGGAGGERGVEGTAHVGDAGTRARAQEGRTSVSRETFPRADGGGAALAAGAWVVLAFALVTQAPNAVNQLLALAGGAAGMLADAAGSLAVSAGAADGGSGALGLLGAGVLADAADALGELSALLGFRLPTLGLPPWADGMLAVLGILAGLDRGLRMTHNPLLDD